MLHRTLLGTFNQKICPIEISLRSMVPFGEQNLFPMTPIIIAHVILQSGFSNIYMPFESGHFEKALRKQTDPHFHSSMSYFGCPHQTSSQVLIILGKYRCDTFKAL